MGRLENGLPKTMENKITNCPYCESLVEETELKHFVNGIRPIMLNEGCEFCRPSAIPQELIGAYDKDSPEVDAIIEEFLLFPV